MSNHRPSSRILRITFRSLAACCLALSGWGCASDHGTQLTLHSTRQGRSFSQEFAGAYASRDSSGNTNIVAVDRACQQAIEGSGGTTPVREIMYIRVMWNPTRDMKMDHTSASNATIYWYVIGNTPATAAEVIEYSGTAAVVLDQSEGETELTIRHASLRPVAWRGQLRDPVGPCALDGTLRAVDNPQRVHQAMSDIRTVVAAANTIPGGTASKGKPEAPSSLAR